MATRVANGKAPAKPFHRAATLDDLYARQPRQEEVPVHLDEAAFRAYEEAARAVTTDPGDDAKAAFDKAKAEMEATTVWVTFRELPRPEYDALLTNHQPTTEQDKDHRERFGVPAPYNMESFPPALIAACALEPQMTEEQAVELYARWPFAELRRLWETALLVNAKARNVTSLGKGWSGTTI